MKGDISLGDLIITVDKSYCTNFFKRNGDFIMVVLNYVLVSPSR
jgi:hypothetical protein